MSSSLVEVQHHPDEDRFDVLTTESDNARAHLLARGRLNLSNAPLLGEVINGHLRARRRFLRLDVAHLHVADAGALAVIASAHRAALGARGTLILTRVSPELRGTFARAGLETELFLVPPAACDLVWPGY